MNRHQQNLAIDGTTIKQVLEAELKRRKEAYGKDWYILTCTANALIEQNDD